MTRTATVSGFGAAAVLLGGGAAWHAPVAPDDVPARSDKPTPSCVPSGRFDGRTGVQREMLP